jgi:flotillin
LTEKKREAEQRKNLIEIESQTVIYEQNRLIDIAKAKATLQQERTVFDNNVRITEIETQKKAAMRDAELQREIEVKNALVTQEKARSEFLSKTTVEA